MTFPLLTSGMLNSILFGIYGNELRRLQSMCATETERQAQWAQHVFLAGSEAGLVHSFIACPIEVVKIRLQTQNRKPRFPFCVCVARQYWPSRGTLHHYMAALCTLKCVRECRVQCASVRSVVFSRLAIVYARVYAVYRSQLFLCALQMLHLV